MRTAKTLIRLGGCPGWSESSLGTHSFCWFCHVVAQLSRQPNFADDCVCYRENKDEEGTLKHHKDIGSLGMLGKEMGNEISTNNNFDP